MPLLSIWNLKNPKLPESPKLIVPTGRTIIVADEQNKKFKVIKGPAIIDDCGLEIIDDCFCHPPSAQ
jgi:hypothetical protein